jgi:hypothetical protein
MIRALVRLSILLPIAALSACATVKGQAIHREYNPDGTVSAEAILDTKSMAFYKATLGEGASDSTISIGADSSFLAGTGQSASGLKAEDPTAVLTGIVDRLIPIPSAEPPRTSSSDMLRELLRDPATIEMLREVLRARN